MYGSLEVTHSCPQCAVTAGELTELKGKVLEIEKKMVSLSKFSSKVMHRYATTLYLLQEKDLKKTDDKDNNHKKLFKFLTEDWGQLFG